MQCGYKGLAPIPQRAYSIKTRIKTLCPNSLRYFRISLREHIPLKQGLRQGRNRRNCIAPSFLREHIPLKQGLRLSWILILT